MSKPQHPAAEVRRWLEVRASEQLTFDQLAQRSGIPVHVLTYRSAMDRRGAAAAAPAPPGFVEVVPVDDTSRPAAGGCIELTLPRGLRVSLAPDFDDGALRRLLAAVGC